jgi:predicted  nucleic acid-binding Zn-ribbon protein
VAEGALEALLEVQARDLAADQLRYRRQSLPERETLRERESALDRVVAALAEGGGRRDELARAQRRLEDEVDSAGARAHESEARLNSGAVSAPRELKALSAEVAALRGRAHQLEDDLLDVMEQAESVAAEVARLDEERLRVHGEAVRLRASLGEQEAKIDAELAVEVVRRVEAATLVPAQLLGVYERLRGRLGGVGVARVDAGRCTGCHLSVPTMELEALRRAAEGTIVCHEECGRILVH